MTQLTPEQEEIKVILQTAGDRIAAVWLQMKAGVWKDSEGHFVGHSEQMCDLTNSLDDFMAYRAKYLGFEDHALTKARVREARK